MTINFLLLDIITYSKISIFHRIIIYRSRSYFSALPFFLVLRLTFYNGTGDFSRIILRADVKP